MDRLGATGISRDAEHSQMLTVSFSRRPTDSEMRAIHDFLRRTPSTCPFCSEATYSLPCTACGEPDIPDAPGMEAF